MDLITGLLLLWGVGKARIGPTVAPPLVYPPAPAWPAPASPPPARPVKRKVVRRVAKPVRPAPRRVVRRATATPAALPPAALPPAAPAVPAMPVAPAEPPPPVHTSLAVRDVQTILNGLGASPSLKVDNLFGPKTAAAWRKAALARDLPAHIVRMAPQVVQVTTYTLDRLRAASGGVAGLYIP
jgi:hypothetical protein